MNILDKKSVSDVIHQFYTLQGYKFEWSLSYNSFNILHTPEYPIAFIGLNPGGDEKTKYNPEIESESGKSAYYYENWTRSSLSPPEEKDLNPLQMQMVKLYARLSDIYGCNYSDLMDKSIMANFVPFRSKDWNSLPNKSTALEFSRQLWSEILKHARIKVIICMSVVVFNELNTTLCELGFSLLPEKSEAKRTGWGRTKYQAVTYVKDNKEVLLIRLPHLSRYKMFNSENCRVAIDDIMHMINSHVVLQSG
ncbi:hypothetical protein [Aeromonas caviae]|uniref:hypothetical protein n=1 Tax=Aeromonas caviae TaxID=648 RepID=UPI00191CD1F3|nr:hypothetical protein [Aeromonas caviae]MBL0649075.1 hypothetical protein [Aeromonas caviae]